MQHIYKNIYCGNELDAFQVFGSNDWVILHCCKDPFHKRMVGYTGNLPPNHPNYKYKISGARMALNLVDMDTFSANYLEFNFEMFSASFAFLDSFDTNKNILIHCNQGESRGPSLTLLYLKHRGYFSRDSFFTALDKFKTIYPAYSPRINIYSNIQLLWDRF